MTINFIGQGLSTEKNAKTVGNYLFSSFKDDHFNKFTGFSAYATSAGLRNLNSALKQAKSTYKEIRFVIGIDDNITTKEVFEGLLNLGIECYTVHTPMDTTFHPKIYIFEGDRKNRIILGSSNLTTNGLYDINVEASVVVEFFEGDISGHKFLNQIKDYFKAIFNGENKNAVRLNLQSPELINLKSNKDKKQIDSENGNNNDSINKDSLERHNKFTNEKDLGDIPSQEKNIDYSKDREYDRTILTPNYFATWHLHFQALKNFKEKTGDTAIPTDFEDNQLVDWCRKQKFLKNSDLIPKEHEDALNSINFYWKTLVDWNSERVWEENFEKFKDYYLKHQTFRVSRKIHKSLSSWVITSRMDYHKGLLLEYQVAKMDVLDPNWKQDLSSTNDNKWLAKLIELETYKKINGNCNVPQDDENLGRWLNDQRDDKRKGKLLETREEFLENLGVVWDMVEYKFQLMVDKLLAYKGRFGNFDVPLDFEDKALGHFVYRLRARGTTLERRALLDAHGFSWEKNYSKEVINKSKHIKKDWRIQLQDIKELHLQGVNVNNISAENVLLKKKRSWVVSQQNRYRSNELKEEQIKLLIDAGVILEKVSRQDQRWIDFYEMLVLYKNENGDCRVTLTYDEELRNWVGFQRTAYKEKTIDPQRIEKLNEIGFEWFIDNKSRNNAVPKYPCEGYREVLEYPKQGQ